MFKANPFHFATPKGTNFGDLLPASTEQGVCHKSICRARRRWLPVRRKALGWRSAVSFWRPDAGSCSMMSAPRRASGLRRNYSRSESAWPFPAMLPPCRSLSTRVLGSRFWKFGIPKWERPQGCDLGIFVGATLVVARQTGRHETGPYSATAPRRLPHSGSQRPGNGKNRTVGREPTVKKVVR